MIEIKNLESYKSDKIKTEKEIVSIVEKLKKEEKKVGLCVGGYDLIHPGHMKHFDSAKRLCDVLIVGVTADKFNTKRKGDGRPVYSEHLRAFSISQLSRVDFVFISNYERAVEPIINIVPNFYIKGPDYANKNTPGITAETEAIKSIGGKSLYTEDEVLSTTKIIKYIKTMIKDKMLLIVDRDGTIIEDAGFLGRNENWKEEIKFISYTTELLKNFQRNYNCKTFVLSNQAGVARGYFTLGKVEEINRYIHNKLADIGIKIYGWKYCPDVDKSYADLKKDDYFDLRFIKEKTERKPSTILVNHLLMENNLSLDSFDKVMVIGDTKDDELLAQNLGAEYIDVNKRNEKLIERNGI